MTDDLIAELRECRALLSCVETCSRNNFANLAAERVQELDALIARASQSPAEAHGVPAGFKLLRDTTHTERNWSEDDTGEGALYSSVCHHCGRSFLGYKRRVTCKVCATEGTVPPAQEAAKPQPKGTEPAAWRVRRRDAPDYWVVFLHEPVDALKDPEREVQPLYALQAPAPAPEGKNWHAHHVAVNKAALQMVRNALRTDAEAGKTVRAEMLDELDKATFSIPSPAVKDGASEELAAQYLALTEAMGYEAGASMLSPEEFAADLRARAAAVPHGGLTVTDILAEFDRRAVPGTGFYEPEEPAQIIRNMLSASNVPVQGSGS